MSVKKTFDTESMYKKIMPSGNFQPSNDLSEINEANPQQQKIQEEISTEKSAEANGNQAAAEKISIPQNIMIYLVRDKMNMVMEKMDCCKCDKCKADIFTRVLNKLTPKYIAGTKEELEEAAKNIDPAIGLEVTATILHEVLALRKNPCH